LIDDHAKPQQFAALLKRRSLELSKLSDRPSTAKGVELKALSRVVDDQGYHYVHIDVQIDRKARTATLTVQAPAAEQPRELADILTLGILWWPLAMARELDDAILVLRTNDLEIGTWILKTRGNIELVLAVDEVLAMHKDHWLVRECVGMLRRTLSRLEVSSRSVFALIEKGSCFGGTLLELALAADRSYMLAAPQSIDAPQIAVSTMNFGPYETIARTSRLESRFYGEPEPIEQVRAATHRKLAADEAIALGLVTAAPDALDWDDEIRLSLEERTSLSPDALTGMEASLRFGTTETMETRIFGRLSAWQNWIFVRPNAVGEAGALRVFGTGDKARFNWERI
jgi:benzoyl-CoA-dihydrodiol lyase